MFRYFQNQARKEASMRIEKLYEKDHSWIIFSQEEIKNAVWIKPGKEFKYKNKMYDIAKTGLKQGKKIYYCYLDKKESNLIHSFTSCFKTEAKNCSSK